MSDSKPVILITPRKMFTPEARARCVESIESKLAGTVLDGAVVVFLPSECDASVEIIE